MLFAILLLGSGSPLSRFSGHSSLSQAFLSLPATRLEAEPAARSRGCFGRCYGATIASYTVWDSYAVTSLHLAPVSYYAGTLLLQTLILTPSALRRWRHIHAVIRADAVPILIVAVFSPLAYILVLTAMLTAPLALVAPVRESSIIIGSLLAYRLFREGHLARRVAGAAIVLAGIAAISV